MTAHQLIKLGPHEDLDWQHVAEAVTPIGERRATLAEVVRAAVIIVAARRLLKGTGWARVVGKCGWRSTPTSSRVNTCCGMRTWRGRIHHAAGA